MTIAILVLLRTYPAESNWLGEIAMIPGILILGLGVCFLIFAVTSDRELSRLTAEVHRLAEELAAFRVNTKANCVRTDEMLQELRDELT